MTTFIAFELTGTLGDLTHSTRFVLNLPVDRMPDDRDNRILRRILGDRDRFVRYLLLLLSEDATSKWLAELSRAGDQNRGGRDLSLLEGSELAERLVRAYSRAPEKLDRVAQLVHELRKSSEGRQLLPEGFEDLWRAIWQARLQIRESR